ncbi:MULTISPECIES: bifunctional aspartate kinase/homoserine dehydrogenase I [Sphingobacterium]|uniref:Bifunctional aspartate kinase/homoserine dehydrogenase I n=1 Tax=Sphingobacterium cellulitidis TaxID=1768011 RepID=A0A8H9FYZ2_9SPHI|nr:MULTISPECIES: bifunctional aspartate kinase/homoserine dehydrogenase I [Sphingobacterium]MBA8987655.1 aspartokinase/homoserine dehydrogenase 1 [Sphingobacterium soli]WFB64327.1 bifunctional aspartate kinase/homoserine dehydrogenase I [Sphingobacterium sp. WM]GGE22039.1 bifunctional aspartate kinase/homoserine dehydrogenase I [Sphingobacterium soli]
MKILKFGGTSVGSVESIKAVLAIVKESFEAGEKPLVVLSAMSGITNLLTKMAEDASEGKSFIEDLKVLEEKHFEVVKKLIAVKFQNPVLTRLKLLVNELEDLLQGVAALKELSNQSKDLIISYGERCSNYLVAKIMEQEVPEAEYINASHYVKTDSNFGNAHLNEPLTTQLIQALAQTHADKLLFVTGFIGSNEKGRITTLGRGGSDYTAAIFGSVLNASAIEIWTDVNGMLTADPRIVKKAFSLPVLSYTEAMELSYFGAKVIYPPTMVPAFMKKIPIVIRNTFQPKFPGTVIQFETGKAAFPIKGISSISDVSVINLTGSGMVGKSGFSGRLFTLLAREQINVILITQSSSEHSITFAVNPSDSQKAVNLIQNEFELELLANKLAMPVVEDNLSILAIVGENMKRTPGMSGKLFHALGRNGINVRAIAQGSSEFNISVIINKEDLSKALNAVHDAFFAELKKTLHVFNIGTGNIGSTLFSQLHKQHSFLEDQNDVEIKVVGISNSRRMYFNADGVDLGNWQAEMDANGEVADLATFISKMQEMNLPNCVFIDNTASKLPATYYENIFKSNISVVTCNKIANSGEYAQYKLLHETARKHGVDFFYETNVGAGLPIVRVLKDLMMSGDQLLKIEAILSGTISYIFNNFKGDASFYDVVKKAQELGYTEPDPRDDLGGIDFMRKMLILGRDAGYPIESSDVQLGNILPESCLKASSVDEFYAELLKADDFFNNIKQEAEQQGKVIRYIGTLENGKVAISLQMVDESHPFYALSGSDNIISFTTERYKERPLVVKGPGAGAEVTAAGVFADLVNVGA